MITSTYIARYSKLSNIFNCNKTKIIAILLVNIFTLWLLSIKVTHILEYPADALFYARQLPIFYWIGLFVTSNLIIYFFFVPSYNRNQSLIELIFLIILILYLFGTPSFIYTNARLWDVLGFSEYVEEVINTGRISTNDLMYRGIFNGATISFSILSMILKIKYYMVAKYYTIYFFLIVSISTYSFAKKSLNSYFVFIPIILLSVSWMSINHMTPQPYAFLLTIFFLPLLISIILNNTRNAPCVILMLLLFWSAIVVGHALTPILLIIALIFLSILLFYRSSLRLRVANKSIFKIIALVTIIYISYIFYTSDFIINRIILTLNAIYNNVIYGDFFSITDRNIGEGVTPSSSYKIGYWIRMYEIAFTAIIGLISIISLSLNSTNKKLAQIISLLFLAYFLISLSLILSGYNMYGYNRAFLFMLIPFSVLLAMVLDIKLTNNSRYLRLFRYSIMLFIISSIILMPITRYASDPYEFIAESALSGRNFISYHTELSNTLIFEINDYNWFELKMQKGEAYLSEFKHPYLNHIYNAGQHKIYIPFNNSYHSPLLSMLTTSQNIQT